MLLSVIVHDIIVQASSTPWRLIASRAAGFGGALIVAQVQRKTALDTSKRDLVLKAASEFLGHVGELEHGHVVETLLPPPDSGLLPLLEWSKRLQVVRVSVSQL
jgi:hypothetical protein